MGVYRSGVDSGEVPQWYWHRGLHDALVLGVDAREFDYDVTQAKPVRNCMTIRLERCLILRLPPSACTITGSSGERS